MGRDGTIKINGYTYHTYKDEEISFELYRDSYDGTFELLKIFCWFEQGYGEYDLYLYIGELNEIYTFTIEKDDDGEYRCYYVFNVEKEFNIPNYFDELNLLLKIDNNSYFQNIPQLRNRLKDKIEKYERMSDILEVCKYKFDEHDVDCYSYNLHNLFK